MSNIKKNELPFNWLYGNHGNLRDFPLCQVHQGLLGFQGVPLNKKQIITIM